MNKNTKFEKIIGDLEEIARATKALADELGAAEPTHAFDLLEVAGKTCLNAAYLVEAALGSYSGDE